MSDTKTANLRCRNGCFELIYQADADTLPEGVDDAKAWLNNLGTPTAVAHNGGNCPACDGDLTVDWGDSDA